MRFNILTLLKKLSIVTLLLFLSGCGGNSACIDADDFGFTVVEVSSRADGAGELIGQEANQLAKWKDFDLRLSGKVLVIMIRNWHFGEDLNSKQATSAWCPWWGIDSYPHTLAPYCVRLRECTYVNNEPCYNIPPHTIDASVAGANPAITNAPCLMKKGMGLYANLQRRGGPDPNVSPVTMRNPGGIMLHAGEPTYDPATPLAGFRFYDFSGNGTMREAGGVRYNYDGDHSLTSTRINYVGGKLYFKILDSYYEDNSGQYLAVIKSGLHEPGGDLFTLVRRLVRERLFGSGNPSDTTLDRTGVVRTIFQNIITTPGYIHAVRGALILYIAVTGIMFMMGSIQLTHAEVISRVIKVAVITALLTPAVSWDFFNEYLFIWMYEGSNFIVEILYDAANTGPGDSSILTFLTTPQIMAKLASLLFSTWQGFIYIIIYFLMLIFLTIVLFNATVLFLIAQVMIGLLISLAPIFIAFYLFESTKSFFENWLKQMIGYAIQSIIVSAGILFLSLIIRNQIYNTLGFRVCLHEFPDMNTASGGLASMASGIDPSPGDGPLVSIFAWWFPHIGSWTTAPAQARILIPKAHFVSPTSDLGFGVSPGEPAPAPGTFCPAYECVGMRYPDLPFLDPTNTHELRQMNLLRSDEIIDWGGIFIIVVCVYLLHHFNTTTVSISKFLSGTTGNLTDTEAAASTAASKLWAAASSPVTAPVKYLDKKTGFRQKRANMQTGLHNFWEKKVLGGIEARAAANKEAQLRKQALRNVGMLERKTGLRASSHGASADLLRKVHTKYGLTQEDVMKFKGNTDAYQKALVDDKILTKKAASGFLKDYAAKSDRDIDSLLAKHHFGKKLSELSKKDQKELREIKESDAFKKMRGDKRKADLFQDAYVDAYKEMATQGSGALSYRQKRQHAIDSRREKNMALGDELKRYLSGGLVGGEFDEISYKDAHMRTHNEMIADKDEIFDAKLARERLDFLTVRNGADIQRPDFLAEERAAGRDMSHYEEVIRENIFNDVHQQLKQSQYMMGDTYVREKMSDEDFGKMISGLQSDGQNIMDHDGYLKMKEEGMYEDDALAEVDAREAMMQEAIDAEIERLKEVKYGEYTGKSSFGEDMASDGKMVKKGFNKMFGKKDS